MDDHINQLNQAKNILSSILGTALQSLDNKHVVQEAKSHIRQAISKLESVSKKQIRKQNNKTNEKMWTNNTAKTVNSPMSNEVAQTVMGGLSKMIAEQQKKLMELEKKSAKNDNDNLITN
jgi:glutamyl-tRNA reductase